MKHDEIKEIRTLSRQDFSYSKKPNKDVPHHEGVGFLLSMRARSSFLDPLSRIITLPDSKGKSRMFRLFNIMHLQMI
ncbi:hypothetical protein ABK046_46490, partial [Streptomyces caeruleatus]